MYNGYLVSGFLDGYINEVYLVLILKCILILIEILI